MRPRLRKSDTVTILMCNKGTTMVLSIHATTHEVSVGDLAVPLGYFSSKLVAIWHQCKASMSNRFGSQPYGIVLIERFRLAPRTRTRTWWLQTNAINLSSIKNSSVHMIKSSWESNLFLNLAHIRSNFEISVPVIGHHVLFLLLVLGANLNLSNIGPSHC